MLRRPLNIHTYFPIRIDHRTNDALRELQAVVEKAFRGKDAGRRRRALHRGSTRDIMTSIHFDYFHLTGEKRSCRIL